MQVHHKKQLAVAALMTKVLDQIQTFVEARCGHSVAQRPFDPGFLVADDGSNDLVCEVYSTTSVTSSTLQLTLESALFSGLAEPALEKATEDHVTSKSPLKKFFNGSGPTLDTLRSRA